jgi:hypothetical protein
MEVQVYTPFITGLLERMPQTRTDWCDIMEEHKNEKQRQMSIQAGVNSVYKQ